MGATLPWIYLTFAGFKEIGWPVGLKMAQTYGQRVIGVIVALAFVLISGFLLWLAQKHIPIGTSYAVWTGSVLPGRFFTASCSMTAQSSYASDIECHQANYRGYFPNSSTSNESGPTRHRAHRGPEEFWHTRLRTGFPQRTEARMIDRRTIIAGAGMAFVASALDPPGSRPNLMIRSVTRRSMISSPCSAPARPRRLIC